MSLTTGSKVDSKQVIDVLLAAADIIEQDGWHQGSMFGRPTSAGTPRPCCALGAVIRAENALTVSEWGTSNVLNGAALRHIAGEELRPDGLAPAAHFNDHIAKSADEVIALLRATASELHEKETMH